MRQHQFPLQLIDLVAINHSIQFLIVTMVDLSKHSEHPVDILVIWMALRGSFFNLFHNEDIFGQPLDWFDEIIFQGKQLIFGIDPYCVEKLSQIFAALAQLIDQERTVIEVIEVLKVEFEEMYFFLYLFEDDLVVVVVLSLGEECCEEQLVEPSDLVYVGENCIGLFFADDLFIQQGPLEVRDYYTDIPYILFLCLQQLLYYHLPLVKIFTHLLHLTPSEDALVPTLYENDPLYTGRIILVSPLLLLFLIHLIQQNYYMI